MKELTYKKQLIAEYEELKKGMSKKKMLKYYSEMAEFMTDNEDNSENDNDSENNNKDLKARNILTVIKQMTLTASDRSNLN